MKSYKHRNGKIMDAETGEEIARVEGIAPFKLKKRIAAFAVEKLNAEERGEAHRKAEIALKMDHRPHT